ncbi:unnamed protein product [Nippostrongylus brasiliensis]|uniref:EGF-like domain-containing protein n=1 Tax=Nippostrongylus brasiliensis TaxID=27835 RepID=A0A158QWU5_NIPBR|nr:unnamed protein product [Nippostrongylus brasiliensis]
MNASLLIALLPLVLGQSEDDSLLHFSNPKDGRAVWIVDEASLPWIGEYEYLRLNATEKTILLTVVDSSTGKTLGECSHLSGEENGTEVCACKEGFIGKNCNVIDVCLGDAACALFGEQSKCVIDEANLAVTGAQLQNASYDCLCPHPVNGAYVDCLALHLSTSVSESITGATTPVDFIFETSTAIAPSPMSTVAEPQETTGICLDLIAGLCLHNAMEPMESFVPTDGFSSLSNVASHGVLTPTTTTTRTPPSLPPIFATLPSEHATASTRMTTTPEAPTITFTTTSATWEPSTAQVTEARFCRAATSCRARLFAAEMRSRRSLSKSSDRSPRSQSADCNFEYQTDESMSQGSFNSYAIIMAAIIVVISCSVIILHRNSANRQLLEDSVRVKLANYRKHLRKMFTEFDNMDDEAFSILAFVGKQWFTMKQKSPVFLMIIGNRSVEVASAVSELLRFASLDDEPLNIYNLTAHSTRVDLHEQIARVASSSFPFMVLNGINYLTWDAPLVLHTFADYNSHAYSNTLLLLTVSKQFDGTKMDCERSLLDYLTDTWVQAGGTIDNVTPVMSRIMQHIIFL